MAQNEDFNKNDYGALKDILHTGILRWHQKWQHDLAALINSPYPEGSNAIDRSMEITKRSRDFYKEAMAMEDYYRKTWILSGIIQLKHAGCLSDADFSGLSENLKSVISAKYKLIYG